MAKQYYIKKDPSAIGSDIEWAAINGKEFYQLLTSPAGKGRYFIDMQCVNQLNRMCLFPEQFPQLTAEQIGQLRDAIGAIDRAIENVSDILWDRPEQNIEPSGMKLGG